MMFRIPIDGASLESAAAENPDRIKGIAERAKGRGAIHHAFYEGDGDVLVVDEWESEEAFQSFFEDEAGEIGPLMAAAGAQGEPSPPSFYRKLGTGDDF